jgi:hypothetical protein
VICGRIPKLTMAVGDDRGKHHVTGEPVRALPGAHKIIIVCSSRRASGLA